VCRRRIEIGLKNTDCSAGWYPCIVVTLAITIIITIDVKKTLKKNFKNAKNVINVKYREKNI